MNLSEVSKRSLSVSCAPEILVCANPNWKRIRISLRPVLAPLLAAPRLLSAVKWHEMNIVSWIEFFWSTIQLLLWSPCHCNHSCLASRIDMGSTLSLSTRHDSIQTQAQARKRLQTMGDPWFYYISCLSYWGQLFLIIAFFGRHSSKHLLPRLYSSWKYRTIGSLSFFVLVAFFKRRCNYVMGEGWGCLRIWSVDIWEGGLVVCTMNETNK